MAELDVLQCPSLIGSLIGYMYVTGGCVWAWGVISDHHSAPLLLRSEGGSSDLLLYPSS